MEITVILTIVVVLFATAQMTVSAVNLLTDNHLPYNDITDGPLISVLIPARNEEANIGILLSDLSELSYRNIEIIVFDDMSTDNTAAIVKKFPETDKRIRLIESQGLPDGWLGKNHACHSLAEAATGEYFLFLDADVRVGKTLAGDALSCMQSQNTGLMSIFPRQIMVTAGEKITVPNMNYILCSLLPLVLVRKSRRPSLAAANGQFMFFQAGQYRKLQPHAEMRNDRVEDISIARFYKTKGIKVSCMLGDERIECRMYKGFGEAVYGFSKNVLSFFGGSALLSLLFWLVTTFGFLAVLYTRSINIITAYFIIYILTRINISVSGRQNILNNLISIIPLQISMGLFIFSALKNKFSQSYEWKGRKIT